MKTRLVVLWGAIASSPFAFGEPEYLPPVDVAAPVIIDDSSVLPTANQPSQLADLVLLTQQLAEEVRELRGIVDEQTYEIRRLQQQRLDDYRDVDRRFAELGSAEPVASMPQSTSNNAVDKPAVVAPVEGSTSSVASEKDMYRDAYNLVKARKFDEAVPAFKAFLTAHPQGEYAGNAYYWLGELYVLDSDFTAAQASMEALVAQFPEHRKVPDAYYKLAKLYMRLGDDVKAKEFANKVVNEYAGKSDTIVHLAQEFIKANYAE